MKALKTAAIDWSTHSFPVHSGYDRTPLPEYGGLPREINSDELVKILDTLGKDGTERIRVTARDFPAVCANLALDSGIANQLKGKRVLAAGEGASNFAQTLEKGGAVCTAVDRIYRTPKDSVTQEYLIVTETTCQSNFRFQLLTADEMMARLPKRIEGADLDKLPFDNKSFEVVFVPNVLYWYLDNKVQPGSRKFGPAPSPYVTDKDTMVELEQRGHTMLREAIRVTADGGYVQLNLAKTYLRNDVAKLVADWPSVKAVETLGVDVVKIHVGR